MTEEKEYLTFDRADRTSSDVIKKPFPLRRALFLPLLFVIFLWLIEAAEVYFNFRPLSLGTLPRTGEGIIGIFTSPLIHAGYEHLLSNSLPLLVVGTGLIFFYHQIAFRVIWMIWLFTGFWVWLAARPEPHIGASGLIYGFVCFLFFSGLLRKDTRLMAVSLLVTFLYGSMVWGILPIDQGISWESHLFGSVAGIFGAIYFRKEGPQRPKTQWEIEEESGTAVETDETESTSREDEQAGLQDPLQGYTRIRYDYREKSGNDENHQKENSD